MEPNEIIWQGKIGSTPLRVGVHHASRIIAEWDTPKGARSKVSSSLEEFERQVLLQLLLGAGAEVSAAEEVLQAVREAQEARPQPAPSPERRRKNPKARMHRRSRRPPRRR